MAIRKPADRREGSASEEGAAVFERYAASIEERMTGISTEEGRALAREAAAMRAMFKRWCSAPPSTNERLAAITRLFALQQRAVTHVEAIDHERRNELRGDRHSK